MERPTVSNEILLSTMEGIVFGMGQKVEKHGNGAYLSNHETLGIVAEEYDELLEAVRSNDPELVFNELRDVAVAAIFGMASMQVTSELIKEKQAALAAKVAEAQATI